MKKIISILLVTAVLITSMTISAFAATTSGTCGENLTWVLDLSTGELVIDGQGEMENYSNSYSTPWSNYRNDIKSIVIGDKVTTISDYAFYSCYQITRITIPDSVTTIGNYAFYNCSDLTSATIGNGVTTIGDYAFKNCDSLTKVTISDSVTIIGDYAFESCDSLAKITIGNNVTDIGGYAFYNCDSLTNITLPDSLVTIGERAFYSCDGLTSVTIPDNVTTIGSYAFAYCTKLANITIGANVSIIVYGAFLGCSKLTDVYYNGTESEWDEIAIANSNEPLLNAKLHFKTINDSNSFHILGDANGDGKVNSLDALACLNHAIDKEVLTGKFFTAADVNYDGKVNSFDALMLLQHNVGIAPLKPTGKQAILNYYTQTINKARADIPGYKLKQTGKTTNLDITSNFYKPTEEEMQNMMTEESYSSLFRVGSQSALSNLPPACSIADPSKFKDITCTVLPNGNYQIEILFNNESNPDSNSPIVNMLGLPDKDALVQDLEAKIEDALGETDTSYTVSVNSMEYLNCSIICEVNPFTGEIISYKSNFDIQIQARVTTVYVITIDVATIDSTKQNTYEYSNFTY